MQTALVRQVQQMRAFDQSVGDRRDQPDIEEKLVSKSRFEFERAAHDPVGVVLPAGERQRNRLKEIERAEARIGLGRIAEMAGRLVIAALLDRRQAERVVGTS